MESTRHNYGEGGMIIDVNNAIKYTSEKRKLFITVVDKEVKVCFV